MVRGRKPEPIESRKARGNPQHRRMPNAPKYMTRLTDPPEFLDELGKRVWRELAVQMNTVKGLLTAADAPAFALMCEAYAQAVTLKRAIDHEGGMTMTSPKGFLMLRPEVNQYNKAVATYLKYAAEFGLTPSSRSRISLPHPANEADDLLDGARKSEPRG